MSRYPSVLFIFVLAFLFSFTFFGCNGGSEDANFGNDGGDPNPTDDDDTWFDDDSTGDDDDTTPPDGPTVRFLIPENGSVLPTRSVLIHGKYWYLNPNDISICERLSQSNCKDKTGKFIFDDEDDTYTASFKLAQGEHTFEVEGVTDKKGKVTDTVTFTVEEGGARIELSVSDSTIKTGDTVSTTVKVYDENDQDITDVSSIDYLVEPEDGVTKTGTDFSFRIGGTFKITASTSYSGKTLEDYKFVFVQLTDADSIEISLSDYDIEAGASVFAEGIIYDDQDQEIFGSVFFHASPPFGASWDINNGILQWSYGTFEKSGTIEVTGTVVGTNISDTVTLVVSAGDPYDMTLTLAEPVIFLPSGGQVTISPVVEIYDQSGNISFEPYTLEVYPTTGATVDNGAKTITFSDAGGAGGTYIVSAYCDNFPSVFDDKTLTVETGNDVDIVFTDPERGFVTQVSSYNIEGYVIDCELSDVLYINDQYVGPLSAPPDCEFFYNLGLGTGLNIVDARLEDAGGQVVAWGSTSILKGSFVPDDTLIQDSVFFGLTEAGFAKLGDIANTLIDDMNIPGIIMSMNPVFDEEYDLWGVTLASATATVTDVSLGDLTINFDINDIGNYLESTIRLNDINLGFDVRGSILGIGYSIDGDVSTDYVEVFGNTEISVVGNNLGVDISTLTIDIAQIDIDINNFPDDLEDMFEEDITNLIEGVVSDALQSEVPVILEALINQIPMEYTFTIDLPNQSNVDVSVTMEPESIITNATGDAFTFGMNSKISMDHISPVPPVMPGSLETPGSPPGNFGMYIWGTSNPYDLGIYFGDEIFNQAFYNIFRAGSLSLDMDEVFRTNDTIALLLLPSDIRTAYPDNAINFKIRPLLPPVLIVGQGAAIPLPTELQMGDFMIHGFVVDDASQEVLFLTIAISFKVEMGIDIPFPTNTIEVTMATPEVVVDMVAEPIADFNDVILEAIAPYVVELVLPIITNLMGGIEIPTFGDYGIQVLQMFPLGSNTDYITIWGDLIAPSKSGKSEK